MNMFEELNTEGEVRLILTIIFQACIDSDTDWLVSKKCVNLLDLIPKNILSNSLGINTDYVTSEQLSSFLATKSRDGVYRSMVCRKLYGSSSIY